MYKVPLSPRHMSKRLSQPHAILPHKLCFIHVHRLGTIKSSKKVATSSRCANGPTGSTTTRSRSTSSRMLFPVERCACKSTTFLTRSSGIPGRRRRATFRTSATMNFPTWYASRAATSVVRLRYCQERPLKRARYYRYVYSTCRSVTQNRACRRN